MMKDNIAVIINSLLYILNELKREKITINKLFRILYFAEQKHLCLYGRQITDEKYKKMPQGAVPINSENIINYSRGNGLANKSIQEASKLIKINQYDVTALQKADLEWLSVSDINCLDESIEENKGLNFKQLTKKSRDTAWDNTYYTENIDKIEIAKAGGADKSFLSYISSNDELERLRFS